MSHVWEPFLTEQDRAAVAVNPPKRMGFGQRPALLLIDLYRWVFGDEPEPLLQQIERWPGTCGLAAWNSLPHIQQLIAAAREARIPVIYSTGLESPGLYAWSKGSRSGRSRVVSDPGMADRIARMYDIVDEVAPIEGEVIIRKASPSAFWGTPLIGQLTYLGIDTLIVSGESTSGCVRSAVVDGCTNRYRMMVVEECVFDRHEATHAMNLFDMDQKYADVVSLAETLSYMGGSGAAAPARELAAVR